MSFPFESLAKEKFRPTGDVLREIGEAMNLDISPQGLKKYLSDGTDYLIRKAGEWREKYRGLGDREKLLFMYFYINILLAKPAASLLIDPERTEHMLALGLTQAGIYGLVLGHVVADHLAPNVIIGGYHAFLKGSLDLPESVVLPASFVAGRITWGLAAGLAQAAAFKLFQPVDPELTGGIDDQSQLDLDLKFGRIQY